jgi:adenine-specific DNA-methyltransferase
LSLLVFAATACALAEWNPYDQNASADFFDLEWMFGMKEGFDVAIGNPPYVRADEASDDNKRLRERILASRQYETLWEKWDLFVPFIEKGFKLLKNSGITTMIVSDAYCHSKYAQKSQSWFLKNSRILRLDFCADLKIFDAAVHNVIYFFQQADGTHHTPERRAHRETFGKVTTLPSDEQKKLTHRAFFPEDGETQAFACTTICLDVICYISKGIVVHANEKVAQGAFELNDRGADSHGKARQP